MGNKEEAKQALARFQKTHGKRKVKNTRLMGSLGLAQQAQGAQPQADATSRRGGPSNEHHLEGAFWVGAHGNAYLAQNAQPATQSALHQDGAQPQPQPQSECPAPVDNTTQKTSAQPTHQHGSQPQTQPQSECPAPVDNTPQKTSTQPTHQHGSQPQPQPQSECPAPVDNTPQKTSTQPTHQHGSQPQPQPQSECPAPVDDTPQKTSTQRLRFLTIVIFFSVILIAMAGTFALHVLEDYRSMSQGPHVQEPGEDPPAIGQHRSRIRLNEAVDIPGLHCMAGRLVSLSLFALPGDSPDPELISEVFKMLKDLSDAEHRLVSKLHNSRIRASEICQRLDETSAATETSPTSSLARGKAIRDIQSLVKQYNDLRQEIIQLRKEIREQADNLVSRINLKAQNLCSEIGDIELTDVYLTQVWGGSGQNRSNNEKQLVLLRLGFCSIVKSLRDHTPVGSRQGSSLSAIQAADRLQDEVVKTLIPRANQASRRLELECGAICIAGWYLYGMF